MRSRGVKPGAKLIEYSIKRASEIGEYINVKPDEFLHYFICLCTGDGFLVALSYTYVPQSTISVIDMTCLENSFYYYLQTLGLQINYAEVEMSAVSPTQKQRELLNISEDEVLLEPF